MKVCMRLPNLVFRQHLHLGISNTSHITATWRGRRDSYPVFCRSLGSIFVPTLKPCAFCTRVTENQDQASFT